MSYGRFRARGVGGTAHDAARHAAQSELLAAQRSLKMAQESKDQLWQVRADLRIAAARATLARLDARS